VRESRSSSAAGSDAAIEVAGRNADTFALLGPNTMSEESAMLTSRRSRRGCKAPAGRPLDLALYGSARYRCLRGEGLKGQGRRNPGARPGAEDKTGYRKPADGHAKDGWRGGMLSAGEQEERGSTRALDPIDNKTRVPTDQTTTETVGTPETGRRSVRTIITISAQPFLIRGFDPLLALSIMPRTDPAEAQLDRRTRRCREWRRR